MEARNLAPLPADIDHTVAAAVSTNQAADHPLMRGRERQQMRSHDRLYKAGIACQTLRNANYSA